MANWYWTIYRQADWDSSGTRIHMSLYGHLVNMGFYPANYLIYRFRCRRQFNAIHSKYINTVVKRNIVRMREAKRSRVAQAKLAFKCQ